MEQLWKKKSFYSVSSLFNFFFLFFIFFFFFFFVFRNEQSSIPDSFVFFFFLTLNFIF